MTFKVNSHLAVAAAVTLAVFAAFFGRSQPTAVAVAAAPPPKDVVETAHAAWSPAPSATTVNPHTASGTRADAVAIGKVARAAGERGHTIAELYEKKAALAGKPVRLNAVVVKSLEGILNRTFIHVRDGSGDSQAGTHELVITSEARPKVGERLLFEGTLVRDRDFGFGYRYPILIENARPSAESR